MSYIGEMKLFRRLSSSPKAGYMLSGIGVIVIGLVLYQIISFDSAALLVESNTDATVFINGQDKGKTPLELEVREEEVTLSLAPEDSALPPFDTKVNLTEGTKTIVRRKFGESSLSTSGQIIQFREAGISGAEIAVASIPDSVEVYLNGQKQGVSPLKFEASPGEHTLGFSKAGYEDMSLQILAVQGYVTTIVVDLAAKLQPNK